MLQPVPTDPQPTGDQADARAQRQAPPAAPPVLDSAWRAGRKLSEARRQRGWTLDEVADRIRVRKEFLEALEEMNVKLLPGRPMRWRFCALTPASSGSKKRPSLTSFRTSAR